MQKNQNGFFQWSGHCAVWTSDDQILVLVILPHICSSSMYVLCILFIWLRQKNAESLSVITMIHCITQQLLLLGLEDTMVMMKH